MDLHLVCFAFLHPDFWGSIFQLHFLHFFSKIFLYSFPERDSSPTTQKLVSLSEGCDLDLDSRTRVWKSVSVCDLTVLVKDRREPGENEPLGLLTWCQNFSRGGPRRGLWGAEPSICKRIRVPALNLEKKRGVEGGLRPPPPGGLGGRICKRTRVLALNPGEPE